MSAGRRRAKGEGTVFWNSERKRWEGSIDLGLKANGKRNRPKATGATESEVARKLAEMRLQAEQGMLPTGPKMSVGELLEHWITHVAPQTREPATLENYAWAIDHLMPGLGRKRVATLTPEDVERVLASKVPGLGWGSLKKVKSVLAQALEWAQKRGYVARNAGRLADLPATARPPKQGRALTPEEARRFLAAIVGHAYEALWLLALAVGLRPGELLGLLRQDLDLRQGVVHIRSSLRRKSKGSSGPAAEPRLGPTKGTRGRRSISLPSAVTAALAEHLERQDELLAVLDPPSPPEWRNLVFCSEAGTPIDPSNLRRELDKVVSRAGLGHLRPYDLRHTAASLLAMAGVPLERIADLLGHDGLRMARLVYIHSLSPTVDAAIAPMNELLGLEHA